MSTASVCPSDFRLVLHDKLSDSYELSQVLLAKAGFDGTLQLLTSAWERVLGYPREELNGKTLLDLMWSHRSTATAVAAILDELDMGPVGLRVRCRNGPGKGLTLHRLYDRDERMMYIVAEETSTKRVDVISARGERRGAVRVSGEHREGFAVRPST